MSLGRATTMGSMTSPIMPCTARLEDCRCAGHVVAEVAVKTRVHSCSAPDCGALWVAPDYVVRLPRGAGSGRPVLRLVAA